MLRLYNGALNRKVMKDLKQMCRANETLEAKVKEKIALEGRAEICDITVCLTENPDSMSNVTTFGNADDAVSYLRQSLTKRVDDYLRWKGLQNDYLLSTIADFIKKNGNFPARHLMPDYELDAEELRLKDNPDAKPAKKLSWVTKQDLAREILEFSEEIFEDFADICSTEIVHHLDPYDDELFLKSDEYTAKLKYKCFYSAGDSSDYSITVYMMAAPCISAIRIGYCYNGSVYIRAKDEWGEKEVDVPTRHLIGIHKFLVKTSKNNGLNVRSQIDYDKIKDE